MFSYSGSVVLTPKGVSVKMSHPIKQLIEDAEVAYVVLDTHPRLNVHNNVVCISMDGSLLWTIENKLCGAGDTYGEGRIRSDGKLEFWNSDSVWVWVDRSNGTIIAARVEMGGPYAEEDGQWEKHVTYY